jgi:hypothetical protein
LGLVADPGRVGDICGKAFARYAASGAEVTLVCAAGREVNTAHLRPKVRALGVRDLVLLDFEPDELSASGLEAVFADIMAGVQPHVVVADSIDSAIREAAVAAFSRVRRTVGGSAALPAKLYVRLPGAAPSIGVTSAVSTGEGAAPELFTRVFPEPWLTGLLERDLFAGIPITTAPTDLEQLAS